MSENPNCVTRSSHSRSLSQPGFFSFDLLPPLSPFSNPTSSSLTSQSNAMDVMMNLAGNNTVAPQPASTIPQGITFQDAVSLPPHKSHRRSNSDVPLEFSDLIQSSPQLIPIGGQGTFFQPGPPSEIMIADKLVRLAKQELNTDCMRNINTEGMSERNSSCGEDKDAASKACRTKTNYGDGSDNEVESRIKGISRKVYGTNSMLMTRKEGIKRSAVGDIAPKARHLRSLSMDSFMKSLHLSDELPKLPVTPANRVDQHPPSNSVDGSLDKFSLDFGSGGFSEGDMKKIMADERLAEIALSDPKRVKRILANRESAARSKERKLRYISELEHKVQTLQTEASILSAKLTIMQKDFTELTNRNSELKFRLQAMEQQTQLRNALHEALNAEIQRLKIVASKQGHECICNQPQPQHISINHPIFEMQCQQPTQLQQLSVDINSCHRHKYICNQPQQQDGKACKCELNQEDSKLMNC